VTDETTMDETPAEVSVGDYYASCELCGWSLTGERGAVIRAGMGHDCHPDENAGDSQPAVDAGATSARSDG